jgi:hypothetical protein
VKIRDQQREKCYKWERSYLHKTFDVSESTHHWRQAASGRFYKETTLNGTVLSLEDSQKVVNKIWQSRYGKTSIPPTVYDGRRRRSACGSRYRIDLPRWSRNPVVIAHETAHAMTYDLHGPDFMRAFIEILCRHCGLGRRETLASARAAKLKIGKALVWKIPARLVSKTIMVCSYCGEQTCRHIKAA